MLITTLWGAGTNPTISNMGNWRHSKFLSNLPKVTQVVNDRAGSRVHVHKHCMKWKLQWLSINPSLLLIAIQRMHLWRYGWSSGNSYVLGHRSQNCVHICTMVVSVSKQCYRRCWQCLQTVPSHLLTEHYGWILNSKLISPIALFSWSRNVLMLKEWLAQLCQYMTAVLTVPQWQAGLNNRSALHAGLLKWILKQISILKMTTQACP